MKQFFCVLYFLAVLFNVKAQDIDVQHYQFNIELNDENDTIIGLAIIEVKALKALAQLSFDLVHQGSSGKGMKVVSIEGTCVSRFIQAENKVLIDLKDEVKINSVLTVQIKYSGIPADGLIISKNKYGDRTFFADNWPNRAHQWIPCNDRPDDKATVAFKVIAPLKYQVISNGILKEKTNLQEKKILTHWEESIAIPTKVMVIGAAQFATALMDSAVNGVPVWAWVYPQDKEKGFYDYSLSTHILNFFSAYIAPYPFKKLANVQSKTIFGGMENASAIFYAESTVTGNRNSEDVIAHEIVHQWFGNMATEKNFSHLWLSEGFATYLTHMYLQQKYGTQLFQNRLLKDRALIVDFNSKRKKPVVDSTSELMELLNANSYQKGGWVLHMLRSQVGDSIFQTIIKKYYAQYKGSNVETADFQKVAENVSGKNLHQFFKQWLFTAGLPTIQVSWQEVDKENISLKIKQIGVTTFHFPLEVAIQYKNGKKEIKKIDINNETESFDLPIESEVSKLILDPNVQLLFEGAIYKGK